MYVYIYTKEKHTYKKIILNKVHLKLTGTMETTGTAASFPVSVTDELAVHVQKHTVIKNSF